jgi:hypothetical protein
MTKSVHSVRALIRSLRALAILLASVGWLAPAFAQACPGFADPVITGIVKDARIDEASGMAASADHPGIYWVHNDSGDTARFFAIREDGTVVVTYKLSGVKAIDWEDMARGPGPVAGVSYLYFGDIGDNSAKHAFVTVYRIPEPKMPAAPGATIELSGAVALEMLYPDSAHDAETLLADPTSGDLLLVTKCSPLRGCTDGISKVYRYPFPHRDTARVTLEQVATINFSGGAFAQAATAGDISAAGDRIVLRTYSQALLWQRARNQTVGEAMNAAPCKIPLAAEPKGETIAFARDGASYLTLSEGIGQPIQRADERARDRGTSRPSSIRRASSASTR